MEDSPATQVKLTFSDHFDVSKETLDQEGLFDISLISDLPLFIDPFLLFYSQNEEYQKLHEGIIKYLVFLRDLSLTIGRGPLPKEILDAYYRFPEIKQNWFGFTFMGSSGHGLGSIFAQALNTNFNRFFNDFGVETRTRHFEKLTLIGRRVGRDTISDFTTNLILHFLASKTEEFAKTYLRKEQTREFTIRRAIFDYDKRVWTPHTYRLPMYGGSFILLTPKNLLTKHATWINKMDLVRSFPEIPQAASDAVLRQQLSTYLRAKLNEFAEKKLDRRTNKLVSSITAVTRVRAALATIEAYPQTIDIYIKLKEERGKQAVKQSEELVTETETFLENQFREFAQIVGKQAGKPTSLEESRERSLYFKKCVEQKEGYKNLYIGNDPAGEDWIQRMFWFVWYGSESDLNREPANGAGEPDFTASQGRRDKTIIEFKLASSSSLEKNLLNQLEEYKKADDTEQGVWVIIFFTEEEGVRVRNLLKKHDLEGNRNYILIDARRDNKVKASKVG